MKFFKLSNGSTINLEQIAVITKPEKKGDPYNDTYGKEYEIVMSSGCRYKCYDSIKQQNVPLFGDSVLKYDDLMTICF